MIEIFLSYSRSDSEFVRRLHGELVARGHGVWVDLEGIRPTAEWMREIENAIDACRQFVFVLTPESAVSRFCAFELERAVARGKRLIPLLLRHVDADAVPKPLDRLQWIDFRDDLPADIDWLIEALNTDLAWLDGHTRYLERAIEWEGKGRRRSLLLRGQDLREAHTWLASSPDPAVARPAELHVAYIAASDQSRVRRKWTLSVASVVLALALVSSTFGYLWTVPLKQALLLCRSVPGQQRPEALALLRLGALVRQDVSMRDALAECLALGELQAMEGSPPGDADVRFQIPQHLKRETEATSVQIYSLSPGNKYGAELGTTATVGRYGVTLFDPRSGNELAATGVEAAYIGGIAVAASQPAFALSFVTGATHKVMIGTAGDHGRMRTVEVALEEQVTQWRSRILPSRSFSARGRVSFSADGRYVIAAGSRGNVKVWDVRWLPAGPIATDVLSIKADESTAIAAAASPDGKWLATLGGDGKLKIFSIADARLTTMLAALPQPVDLSSADLFEWSDATTITDGTHRWRFSPPWPRAEWTDPLLGAPYGIRSLAFDPTERYLAAAITPGRRTWLIGLAPDSSNLALEGEARAIAFAADGNSLLGTTSGDVLRWPLTGGRPTKASGRDRSYSAIAARADGSFVTTGSESSLDLEVELARGAPALVVPLGVGTFLYKPLPVFSPDGTSIVAGLNQGDHGTSVVIDLSTGRQQRANVGGDAFAYVRGMPVAINGFESALQGVVGQPDVRLSGREIQQFDAFAISSNGTCFAAPDDSGTLNTWNAATGARMASIKRSGTPQWNHIALSPSGRFVAAMDGDDLSIWSTRGTPVTRAQMQAQFFFFHDESSMSAVTSKGELISWRFDRSPVVVKMLAGLPAPVEHPAFWAAKNGSRLLQSGSTYLHVESEGTRAWDVDSGDRVPELESAQVFQAFSSAGDRRARVIEHEATKVWTSEDPDGWSLDGISASAKTEALQLSSSGRDLLVMQAADRDSQGTVRLIDVSTRRQSRSWSVPAPRSCMAADAGLRYLAVCAKDAILVFDGQRGEVAPRAESLSSPASVAFNRASTLMAVASRTSGVWLIDPKDGRQVLHLTTGVVALQTVAFSPSSRWLAAVDAAGHVFLWDLERLVLEFQRAGLRWPVGTSAP